MTASYEAATDFLFYFEVKRMTFQLSAGMLMTALPSVMLPPLVYAEFIV